MVDILENYFEEYKDKKEFCFWVKVLTRKSKTQVIEVLEDKTLKVEINALRDKGKANDELIRFLSKELALLSSCISIRSGKTSTKKLICIKKKK